MVINSFIKANLISLTHINVMLFTSRKIPDNIEFNVYSEESFLEKAKLCKRSSNVDLYFFDIELSSPYDFSKRYYIGLNNFPLERVDVSNAVDFAEFDDLFNYDGDDLGSFYSKTETSFAVWAPLSPTVSLNLEISENKFAHFKMKRDEKGVHRFTIPGDFKNARYRYRVETNGVKRETNDPYAIETSLNSEYSVVVDRNDLCQTKVNPSNEWRCLLDSIIYEVGVRDFTENKNTNVVNKGKYLGFIEKDRKTSGGNVAGLDYLKYLGITHVQLNPILDFRGVKDDDPLKSYNWGYDPISLFAIEGSYATHPEIPGNRIKEFQEMVNELHRNGIRVVVDVVYNHIYDYVTSSLQKCVPNYYFRRRRNGEICEASGCGNELASERYMVRKIIVDSCKNLVDLYDIDGFRFDLMGLLDIETMKCISKACDSIKKGLIYYGEGWNIPNEIPFENRPCTENSFKLPNYAFFNDTFRDIVKGPNFRDQLRTKGYANGDISYRFGMDFAFHGSVCKHSYIPRYKYAHQSLNYIECHDNFTLFDKLCGSNPDEDEQTIYKRVNLANLITIFSIGVPFIHMGQEIGQTKFMHDNTYNEVKINNLDWNGVDERFWMVTSLKRAISNRKSLSFYSIDLPEDIDTLFKVDSHFDECLLSFFSKDNFLMEETKSFAILINPTNKSFNFELDDYYTALLNDVIDPESYNVKNFMVSPLSLNILYKV